MRISSALLTAAMILSGIVVIEANPASAQSYSAPVYGTGYAASTYQGSYASSGYQGGGYRSGYTRPGYVRSADVVVYEDAPGYHPAAPYGYGAEPVAIQTYEAPVYEAPRYRELPSARPTYVTQTYAAPVDPCRDRGW